MPEGAGLGTTRYQRSPTALWRRLTDRVVVAGSSIAMAPVVLNETGALVWDLLERSLTLDELVSELRLLRDGPESLIRDDVVDLLQQLCDREVVVTP